jgi:CHAD domain-containing protein
LRLHIDSNLDADQALIKIFNQCTKTIHLNTEGIVADLDVEFLHDYRVATRRIRSGISFAKKLFDWDALKSAKTDMRMLGNATNKLRDIDVYLQREIKIKKSLPPEMSEALNPFFCALRKERILEQRKLKNFLKSNVYYEIIDRWELFLKENEFPDNPITNKISEKVGSIANKQILKALSKLMTEGYKINRDSPDEMLHELRIHGKKLRYLMEFYSSLYSENQVESFINNLKTLQKCLGKFNDRSMQQLKLNEYIKKLCIDKESIPLATAMGILIGNLQMDKVTLKCDFFVHFENFCSKNNLLNAQALFDYQPNS